MMPQASRLARTDGGQIDQPTARGSSRQSKFSVYSQLHTREVLRVCDCICKVIELVGIIGSCSRSPTTALDLMRTPHPCFGRLPAPLKGGIVRPEPVSSQGQRSARDRTFTRNRTAKRSSATCFKSFGMSLSLIVCLVERRVKISPAMPVERSRHATAFVSCLSSCRAIWHIYQYSASSSVWAKFTINICKTLSCCIDGSRWKTI